MIKLHHYAAVALLTCALPTLTSSAEFTKSYATSRLPRSVVPSAYHVTLVPYLSASANSTFDGDVLITVLAVEAADNITLHANRLSIVEASIVVHDVLFDVDVAVVGVVDDPERQFYSLVLGTPLRAGTQYTVHVGFSGTLDDDLAGFYRSSYVENGVQRWLATTLLFSDEARRVFPCFDEPALKARFAVAISRPADLRAISNMPQDGPPVLDTVHTDQLRYWDSFLETPLMSTYLIAFVVSDFVYVENAAEQTRVFARPQMIGQARYALSRSPAVVTWLAEFTGIDFHLPKLDHIAVPDFSYGAMENWGLVTYRERQLLFEEGVSKSMSRQSTATVIAHELSHQWFGDLVTPVAWHYIWLSEGFATYFEYFCTAQLEPSWRLDEQFAVAVVQEAMSGDATQDSHPMTAAEGATTNSVIVYSKAGSVIRMMESIMSPVIFRRGLRRYLTARSYNSATAQQLFDHLNSQLLEDNPGVEYNFTAVMDTWHLQMGFPVVTVARDYAANTAQLRQARFLLSPDPEHPDTHDYRWHVPLTYTTQGAPDFESTRPMDWFDAADDVKTITDLPGDSEWVLFNIRQAGYYRVNYDAQNWALVTSHLSSPQYEDIHVMNRAQLVDDSFNLARAAILGYDTPLALSRYLGRETDYVVWSSAFKAFTFIDTQLRGTHNYTVWQNYLLTLMDTVYTSVGLEETPDDDHVTRLTREAAVKWACDLDDPGCTDHSTGLFADWMTTPDTNPIAPDIKSAVYCTALRLAGGDQWNFLYDKYLQSLVATETTLIIDALGCTTDVASLNMYMSLAITQGSSIRRQDSRSVFKAVYTNNGGLDTALEFVVDKFREIANYYGSMDSVGGLLVAMADKCSRQDQADKIQSFLDANAADLGDSAAAVAKAVTIVNGNIKWVSTAGPEIIDWINANSATT